MLNSQTRKISEKILSECAIGVHVRRGDYIEPHYIAMYGHICTSNYYKQALKQIINKVTGCYFIYFFNDDPDWVKLNNPFSNSLVVDWNRGNDFWQDIYLMSLCRHNVIANSTFSWWGAWLNAHKDKMVVAPYRCFNTLWTPNIHPKEWMTIYPKGYIENGFVKLIEKNEITINRNGLLYGKMGIAVFLFHYASIRCDPFYNCIAMNFMTCVLGSLDTRNVLDYADGLTGIGVAIEYLYQNAFLEGDANKMLNELDLYFDALLSRSWQKIELENGLLGLIRYYRFRMMGEHPEKIDERQKINRLNLRRLVVLLNKKREHLILFFEDVVSELYELYLLDLCTEQVKYLLEYSFSNFTNDFFEMLQQAAHVNSERILAMQLGNEPGLMGMAGKELKILSPVSKVHWTMLL